MTSDPQTSQQPPIPRLSTVDAAHGYIQAVRSALLTAGFEPALPGCDYFLWSTADPMHAQIPMVVSEVAPDGPAHHRWTLLWAAHTGWSAGLAGPDAMAGPGPVTDRRWLNIGRVPPPALVVDATLAWQRDPGQFATRPPAYSLTTPLEKLLDGYGPDGSLPLAAEHEALRAKLKTTGLTGPEHFRLAEILVADYGDEYWQTDLAAAQVHASLARAYPAVQAQRDSEAARAARTARTAVQAVPPTPRTDSPKDYA